MHGLPTFPVSQRGGDPAIDLLNTVDWRLDPERRHERLASFAHVVSWMHAVGMLSHDDAETLADLAAQSPHAAAREHARILTMREDAYEALTEGSAMPAVEAALIEARSHARLTQGDDGRWTWHLESLDLASPYRRISLALERVLSTESMRWFHRCEDDHCGWVFLDTSRQHSRRWCSSADCGNRNRVRAHHARARAAAPE